MTCSICNQPMIEPGFACPECTEVLQYIVEKNRPIYEERKESQSPVKIRPETEYIAEICDTFGIDSRTLTDDRYRGRDLLDARYLYMYVLWYVYGRSHRKISKLMHREPCNVSHAKNSVKQLLKTSSEYRDKTKEIFKMIEEDTK